MTWQITPISVATAVGMFMSTGFFAIATSTSFSVIPALMLAQPEKHTTTSEEALAAGSQRKQAVVAPSHLARQWKVIYDHGKKAGPFTAGLGSVSWIYVASVAAGSDTRVRNLYLAGTLFLASVVPFTFTVMRNSVSELNARAEIAEAGEALQKDKLKMDCPSTQSTETLLREWAMQNFIRGLLPLAGMSCIILANI